MKVTVTPNFILDDNIFLILCDDKTQVCAVIVIHTIQ